MSTPNLSTIGPEIRLQTGTPPLAQTAATVVGAAIDRLGFDNLVLDVEVGAATGAPTSFTCDVKVQHCDTSGGTYADWQPLGTAISGAVATITATGRKRKTVDLKGAKRYLKVSNTVAFVGGASPTLPNAAVVLLGGAAVLPAQVDD